MGYVLNAPMQPTELVEEMKKGVDWGSMSQPEAQELHRSMVKAARLVTMTAPHVLRSVTVKAK